MANKRGRPWPAGPRATEHLYIYRPDNGERLHWRMTLDDLSKFRQVQVASGMPETQYVYACLMLAGLKPNCSIRQQAKLAGITTSEWIRRAILTWTPA